MLPASDEKTPWPPPAMVPLLTRMGQWSALYSGDLATIQAAFAQSSTGTGEGGLKGAIGRGIRYFLGEAPKEGQENRKVPVPIAAEICQASSDLLFADPITVTADGDKPTEERLAVLLDDRFHAALAQSAELGAALGGSFLRATWDLSVYRDRPFTTVVDTDCAVPEFAFGRLKAVTFWWVVRKADDIVWRHLERHELDSFGNGVILHGLYQGAEDRLGPRISLASEASTAALALHTDLNIEGTLDTKSPGLAVQYIPNQTPNRGWRTDAVGRYLGRSDLDGVEHLIDQLAEVMSAWLRAIRLAKARLFIDKALMTSAGPGKGLTIDLEREAYVAVQGLRQTARSDNGSGGGGSPIQLEQAKVEYEQYRATVEELVEDILQFAGYSAQTFGKGEAITGTTATEVEQRERRSLLTRDRKIRESKPAIGEHIAKLLWLDNTFFGGKSKTEGLDVAFPEGVQASQLALAQTVQALYAAESASIQTRVETLHPDWDDEKVAAEVKAIRDEFAPDPGPLYPPGYDGTVTGGDDGDEPAAA